MEGSMKASGVDVGGGTGGEVGVRVLNGIVERNDIVGRGKGVFVGIALCVSASVVLTVEMAVSIRSAWLSVGVDWKLLQDASMTAARNKGTNVLPKIFIFHFPLMFSKGTPNGWRSRINDLFISSPRGS